MIVYNVTINVDNDVAEDFIQWMQNTHIPDVMITGQFLSYKMLKLLSEEDNGGTTFAIQYFLDKMDNFDHYQTFHAKRLQGEVKARYDGKYVAFRTVLEVLHQSS